MKGSSREILNRHTSSIIPFLTFESENTVDEKLPNDAEDENASINPIQPVRNKRKAAISSSIKTRNILLSE